MTPDAPQHQRPVVPDRFDDDYLYFLDAQFPPERNAQEASLISELLGMRSGRILDAPCGAGRVALPLADLGFEVHGIDGNPMYIERATTLAQNAGVEATFGTADLRTLTTELRFDAIVNWYISLGYFDEDDDRAILQRFADALRPGGTLLVELPNLSKHLALETNTGQIGCVERGDDLMVLQTRFNLATYRNEVKRTIIRDGITKQCSFSIRFYTFPELASMLADAGFTGIRMRGRSGDLRPSDGRMFVLATRP